MKLVRVFEYVFLFLWYSRTEIFLGISAPKLIQFVRQSNCVDTSERSHVIA